MTDLHPLFASVAHEQDELLSSENILIAGRRRFLSSNDVAGPSPRANWMAWAVGGCCAVAALATMLVLRYREPRELTASVGESNAPILVHARIATPENASTPLRFSDGTRVEVGPRSEMTVVSLDSKDIRLSMETGRAGFNVVHEDHRQWELRAGPFAVNITGTRFDVAWDPLQDRFELALTEGQVELTGCGFGAGRRLVAGQTVRASCRKETVEIAYASGRISPSAVPDAAAQEHDGMHELATDAAPVPSNGDTTSERGPKDPEAAWSNVGASPSAAPTARSLNARSEWRKLAKEERYQEALSALDRIGFTSECSRIPVDELARVADIARRAHEPDKARQALLAVRQRFSKTSQAGVAAFKLGVLEFDQMGSLEKAAFWFRAYLSEQPTGPLRREARGRLMEVTHRSGSPDAKGLAADYLRDYPTGPHAELAQRIVAAH
ncbi:MAG TPA: FecR domain-containing protein [Polyangiaceae bacterium]